MSNNSLAQLKQLTTVVADTGDFERMREFHPQDATTNPSLILKAVQIPCYGVLVEKVLINNPSDSPSDLLDRVLVAFGLEILKIVPGRVSTEVDARLSFDTVRTIAKARHLIGLYEELGIDRQRVLIKLASTWESIEAAKVLEAEGIHCNMTLLFSLVQAVACANAQATLISPFVGRISDWYKKSLGAEWSTEKNAGPNDPGVLSVKSIYGYYKHFDIKTEIMGASFRNVDQILQLAGCDLLTISPELLAELQSMETHVEARLGVADAKQNPIQAIELNRDRFHQLLNADPMASEKLSEGIKTFCADIEKLEALLA